MQTQSQNLESAFNAIKGASVQQQERVIAFINSLMNEKTETNKPEYDAGKFNVVFGMLKTDNQNNANETKQVGNFDKFAGILTAKKHVTVEQMNETIRRRGAGLDCD